MLFTPIGHTLVSHDTLSADYETATSLGAFRIGGHHIFVRQLFRTGYLPYHAIAHAFLRREEVRSKLCCGIVNMDQFHLVLVESDGTEHQLHLEDQRDGNVLLESISARQPSAKIGYER